MSLAGPRTRGSHLLGTHRGNFVLSPIDFVDISLVLSTDEHHKRLRIAEVHNLVDSMTVLDEGRVFL